MLVLNEERELHGSLFSTLCYTLVIGIFNIIVIVIYISSEASGPIIAGNKTSPGVTANAVVLETNLQEETKFMLFLIT